MGQLTIGSALAHHQTVLRIAEEGKVGNRSILFNASAKIPEKALRHCIGLALTYHARKASSAKKKTGSGKKAVPEKRALQKQALPKKRT